jgi:hypothetical protein
MEQANSMRNKQRVKPFIQTAMRSAARHQPTQCSNTSYAALQSATPDLNGQRYTRFQ